MAGSYVLGTLFRGQEGDTKDAWDSTSAKNAISKFLNGTMAKISRLSNVKRRIYIHRLYRRIIALPFGFLIDDTKWISFLKNSEETRDKLNMTLILKIFSKFFTWQISSESSLGKSNIFLYLFFIRIYFSYFSWATFVTIIVKDSQLSCCTKNCD